MNRAIQIGGLLLAAASAILGQKGGAKPPKAAPAPRVVPGKPGNAKPNNPRPNNPGTNAEGKNESGNPGGRAGQGGPHLPNPLGNQVLRMMAMPPEQRERILEKLPPQQQAKMRQSFDEFEKLPPAERTQRLQLLRSFYSLPPEKQQVLARQLPAFNALPDDRRKLLRRDLVQLSRMPEADRQARLSSEEFKSKYSETELQMLSDISQNYPFPGK